MPTVTFGDFEWDQTKAAKAAKKHGVTFKEATTVFADPSVCFFDDGSNVGRLIALGVSQRGRLLCVVHEERGARLRLITARVASTPEQKRYTTGGD